jgi:hypothetical protein
LFLFLSREKRKEEYLKKAFLIENLSRTHIKNIAITRCSPGATNSELNDIEQKGWKKN